MSEGRFRRGKEFDRREKAPHDWPAQQGLGRGRDNTRVLTLAEYQSMNRIIRATADQTSAINDTTFVADTHLYGSVKEGERWEFNGVLGVTATSGSADFKMKFTAPVGAAGANGLATWYAVYTGDQAAAIYRSVAATDIFEIGTTATAWIQFTGSFLATGDGSLELHHAPGGVSGGTNTRRSGSWMVMRRAFAWTG